MTKDNGEQNLERRESLGEGRIVKIACPVLNSFYFKGDSQEVPRRGEILVKLSKEGNPEEIICPHYSSKRISDETCSLGVRYGEWGNCFEKDICIYKEGWGELK